MKPILKYVGGGAVYFYLESQNAIINDINNQLIRFYLQVRDNYDLMRQQIDMLKALHKANSDEYLSELKRNPNAKNKNYDLFNSILNLLNDPNDESLLYGTKYFFLNKTTFSTGLKLMKDGRLSNTFDGRVYFNDKTLTYAHSLLLNKTKIYNLDYKNIFDMAKENDFMFLDPPYVCDLSRYANTNDFDIASQYRLSNDFKNLKCRALMIIGKTPLTEKLYKDFIVEEYYKKYNSNYKLLEGIHLVVKNY